MKKYIALALLFGVSAFAAPNSEVIRKLTDINLALENTIKLIEPEVIVDPPLPPTSVVRVKKNWGGGNIWKPISESTGKCVVIFEPKLTGKIKTVHITRDNWTAKPGDPRHFEVLQHGGQENKRGDGNGQIANGNREHWWLSRPGSKYGKDIYVVAITHDGVYYTWLVRNGADRRG